MEMPGTFGESERGNLNGSMGEGPEETKRQASQLRASSTNRLKSVRAITSVVQMIEGKMRTAQIIKSIPQVDAQVSINELFEVCSDFTNYCGISTEIIRRVGTRGTQSL